MAIAWWLTVSRWILSVYIEMYYLVSWKKSIFLYLNWRRHLQKFVSMRFVSIVIDSPSSLNKLIMFFLILSTLGPLCSMASPSSLYKPTLLEAKGDLILFRRHNPTSSLTSALSKLPIVTSNNRLPSCFTEVQLSSNNKDFLAWFMVLIIFPSILI